MADTHSQTRLDLGVSEPGLLRSLADNWWLLLLRGIAAIGFGGCKAMFLTGTSAARFGGAAAFITVGWA